jgi:ABC-type antimicrobial peptide transport system permease subunit
MGNYSKLIGSIVGGFLSWVVAKYALPPEWSSTEVVQGITIVIGSALVYLFPANKPA